MSKKYILLLILFWLIFQPSIHVNAALGTKVRICSVKGTVQTGAAVQQSDGKNSTYTCPLKRTMNQTECRVVNQETMVETGDDGWATIEYPDGIKLKIMPNSKVVLSRNNIFVESGSSWFKIEKHSNGELVVKTPTAIAGIRGTEFIVNVEKDGATNFQLIEGSVEISDADKKSSMMLAAGMEVNIPRGSSTLNTALLNINENDQWWTDWPTLVPIAEMPGYTGGTATTPSSDGNTFYPIADNHVYAYSYSNWNNANWGKYEQLGAGWNPTGGEKRAFLMFDLSGVDPNNLTKATLKLYHNHTGGGNAAELGVYRLLSNWNEGRGTYKPASAALPGELTWNNQPQIDRYPVVYFNPGQGINNWVEVDVTSLVRAWLTGVPNYGMAIKAGENYIGGSESQYGFYSREYEDASKRPHLVLNGTDTQINSNNGNSAIPLIAGDWEITCNDGNIYKYHLKLVQYEKGFYGDMIRINGNEENSKVEGSISQNGSIEYIRSRGNWKQYYIGSVVNQSGAKAIQIAGTNGMQENRGFTWNAILKNTSATNFSVAGQWNVNQYNGFKGILNFQQNQSGQLTGNASWDRHVSGTISGQITGNSIAFNISYPNGIQGIYKGTVTQNGVKIINGSVTASDGRTNSNWDASKVAAVSSITGKWLADQNNGYNGTLNLQQDGTGRITGDAIWNGYLKGIIKGQVSGNAVEFTITYPNGDIGTYKGTLTQNGTRIINGTVKGNNGVSAAWEANK